MPVDGAPAEAAPAGKLEPVDALKLLSAGEVDCCRSQAELAGKSDPATGAPPVPAGRPEPAIGALHESAGKPNPTTEVCPS